MKTLKTIAAAALLAATSGVLTPVLAHVTLEYQVAPAGSSYKASFKVSHGCGASPTRQIVVDVPAGMRGARPMPKAGWMLEVQRGKPVASAASEDVVRITWTAKTEQDMLSSAHYDEFVLVATAPQQAGTLYWPVRQICPEGRSDWVEIPQAGQPLSALKSPAAALEILPGAGAAGHQH
jgi:uncharacterized protein YcnI